MFKQTYSIGDASKLSGVSQKQIRNWELKGYIPEAERVVAGDRAYRRFTPEDVELMRRIKNYVDEGFTLRAASEKAKTSTQPKKGIKSTPARPFGQ
jgi:DNA-binding transcriptional MerR regulator